MENRQDGVQHDVEKLTCDIYWERDWFGWNTERKAEEEGWSDVVELMARMREKNVVGDCGWKRAVGERERFLLQQVEEKM